MTHLTSTSTDANVNAAPSRDVNADQPDNTQSEAAHKSLQKKQQPKKAMTAKKYSAAATTKKKTVTNSKKNNSLQINDVQRNEVIDFG